MTQRLPISGVSRNPLLGLLPRDMGPVAVGVPIADLAPVAHGALMCRVNGEWLLRESWASPTRYGDVIEWYDVPRDKEDVRGLLAIAAVVVSFIPGLQFLAPYIYAASIAYNILVPPTALKPPQRPGETGDGFSTGLSGNEARLDQPIWKICGRREITPPFACQPYFEYLPQLGEPDPNLDNEQYAYYLFTVGIGNYDVLAKIANTPIGRFADVLIANYLAPGEQPSTITVGDRVIGVSANVTTATEVSSQVLDSGRYVGGFAACAPQRTCSAVGIDVVATRGLGKTGALSVSWRVEYREINDFGQVLSAWATLGSEQTRSAFTSTPQRWTVRFELTIPARVEIRIVRTDVQDTDPQALHEIAWTGLRAYLAEPAPLNEHAAHFEVVMRASSQLSQIASRDFRLITEAYCRTLDESLDWQAEEHTRNPAWWLLDLATSDTWGIDKPDNRIDLQSFYDLAQTADARQDRFDMVFDATVNAWDAMQTIARACRARVFRRNGVLSVARDELADLPVTAFTPRNCRPGMSINEKLRQRNSPDGFIIEYQDHRTWEWTEIDCPCPGVTEMAKPIHKRLEGIVGATHAHREGLYESANLIYRPRVVGLTTEMQGMLPAYMSPVDFIADIKGYGNSGDVAHWDAETLIMGLTEPADFSVGLLYLTLIRHDGTLTDPVLVTPGPTAFDVVLPAAPDFDMLLDHGGMERPKYLIGAKDLVKVTSIMDGGKTEEGAQLFNLTGVIDDERVHLADVALLPGPGEIQDPVGNPDDSDDDGFLNIVEINDHTLADQDFGSGPALARYTLHYDGVASEVYYGSIWSPPSQAFNNEWLNFAPVEMAVVELYECRATLLSGALTTGTLDTWMPMGPDHYWEVTVATLGSAGAVIFVEIREIATGIVQDSATITLSAISSQIEGE